MKIIFKPKIMLANFMAIKKTCNELNVNPAFISKKWSYKYFKQSGIVPKYGNPNFSYKVEESGIIGGNHITSKTIPSKNNYQIVIPVNDLENREGVTISKAKKIAKGRNVTIWLNYGCANNILPSYSHLNNKCKAIKKEIPNAKISIGGSLFLGYKLIPNLINEIRIGEALLVGNIPYFGLTYNNPFKLKINVIKRFKDRLLLDIGNNNLTNDTVIKNCTILSISDEYTVVKPINDKYNKNVVTAIPSYKTLRLING